jgi:hypothetical protein
VNRLTVDLELRFSLLELLRPSMQFICHALSKHYLHQTQALTEKNITVFNLSQTLHLEIVYGYKIILEALHTQSVMTEPQKIIFSTSIERVFHYNAFLLLKAYQLYLPPPTEVWQELHILYPYSKNNILYLQLLIFSALDPYGLRQVEQEKLYHILPHWIPYGKLMPQPSTLQIKTTDYFINTHSDLGAIPYSVLPLLPESTDCYKLDLQKIQEHVQTILTELEPNELSIRLQKNHNPEYTIPTSVLHYLSTLWSGKRAPRNLTQMTLAIPENTYELRVCFGLSNAHYYLNHEKSFQPPSTETNSNFSLPSFGFQEETTDLQTEGSNTSATDITFSSNTPPATTQYLCQSVTEANNFLCVEWKETNTYPSLQPGDLVTLQQGSIERIGTLRWITHVDDQLRLGIECITSNASANAIQLMKAGQASGYYLRCLLFDDQIITPTLPFKRDSQATIILEDESSMEVHLIEVLDITHNYKQFKIIKKQIQTHTQAQVAPEASTASRSTKSEKSSRFDTIWDDL